jgi:hypothetical protein
MHPPVIQPRRTSNADSGGLPLPSSTLPGSLHYIPSLPMVHRPSFDPAEKDRNSGKVGKTFPPSTWRMDFPLPSQPIHLDQSSLTGHQPLYRPGPGIPVPLLQIRRFQREEEDLPSLPLPRTMFALTKCRLSMKRDFQDRGWRDLER